MSSWVILAFTSPSVMGRSGSELLFTSAGGGGGGPPGGRGGGSAGRGGGAPGGTGGGATEGGDGALLFPGLIGAGRLGFSFCPLSRLK